MLVLAIAAIAVAVVFIGNKLLGGGEAGSETVVGTDSLLDMIRKAVLAGQNAAGKLTAINNYGNTYGDSTVNATINVYAAEGMDERNGAHRP